MGYTLGDRAWRGELTRRDFLWLVSAASASVVLPPLSGCATHPVTGESVLVGLSEGQEIALDRQYSKQQFSKDYGAVQEAGVNAYLSRIGTGLAARTHRPQMPYSFRAVNANYLNAYAFPGGSIAMTRGMLAQIEDESQLAGLLGHELSHVNARHSAQQAGKGLVAELVVAGIAVAAESSNRTAGYAPVIAIAGQIGASALLASYSRDHEREADRLGMEYMTRSGYPAQGMTGLLGILVRESKDKPGLLDTMFSSHPVSSERLAAMQTEAVTRYAQFGGAPVHRERYMDNTAALRRLKPVIDDEQKGERAMSRRNLEEAEGYFAAALKAAPQDYPGLCLMSKCMIAQRRHDAAADFAQRAKQVYPGEGQAMQLLGLARLAQKRYPAAFEEFDTFERALPGDPNAAFFKGVSLEGMQSRDAAAREYRRYLATVKEGDQAKYAAGRLKAWGYLR